MVTPPEIRFWRHVNRTEECWLWTGVTAGSKGRYGYFRPGTKTSDPKIPAHRYSYELATGKPIPPGVEIDHVAARGCTSRLCVKPDHLEAVTPEVNSERVRLPMCRAGLHDLTAPENQRWDEKGRRRGCLPCHRTRAVERYRKKVA